MYYPFASLPLRLDSAAMGCSSSVPSSKPCLSLNEVRHAESHQDLAWLEQMCGKQDCTRSLQRLTPAVDVVVASPSTTKAKLADFASDDQHLMEITWTQLLCGLQENDDTPCNCYTSASSGAFSPTSSRKELLRSDQSSQDSSDVVDAKLDIVSTEIWELQEIQVNIFAGMLIALADSGSFTMGVGALPCNPKTTLMKLEQLVSEDGACAASYVLALVNLVVAFKNALIDAGVDRVRSNEISANCQTLSERISESRSFQFSLDAEMSQLAASAKTMLRSQKWDEVGYVAGRMALHLG